jgi:hypothetical protein
MTSIVSVCCPLMTNSAGGSFSSFTIV